MCAQIKLEMRKQPWKLYLLWVILLVIVLAIPMIEVRTYQNGYTGTNQQIEHFEQSTKASVHSARQALRPNETNSTAKKAMQVQRRVLSALHKKDYSQVNKLLLGLLRAQPRVINSGYGQNYYAVGSGGAGTIKLRLKYMVDHNLNRLIQVDYDSAAVNVLGIIFKSDDVWAFSDSAVEMKVTVAFIIMAAITFCYIFWYGNKDGNDELLIIAPITQRATAVIRIMLVAILLELSLVLSFVIVAVLYGVNTHEFGSLMYPIIIRMHQQLVVRSLAAYFVQVLIYFGLWLLLLGSLIWMFSGVMHSQMVTFGLVILLVCLKPLGIGELIPVKIAQLLPGSYLQPSLILHQGTISLPQFSLIILGTILVTICVWLAAISLRRWKDSFNNLNCKRNEMR